MHQADLMIRSDTPAVPHRGNQLAANTATVLLVAALGYACAKLIIGFLPHSVGSAPLEPTRSSASPTSGNRATAVERAASARLFGDAGATPEIAKAEPAKEAPVTTLNLRLLGVLATDDSRPAYAIINGGGGEQVLGIGDEIERAVLREIHTAHVIIENRGKLERLELPKLELDGAAVAPVAAAQTSSPAISNSAEGGQGLVNVNDLPQTPGALRDYLVRNPATMQQLVSIGAYRENGKVVGYRLMPKQDTAILRNYGIESGDVVTSLNGVRLDNQRRGLKALRQLVTASNIDMTVLRNGAEVPISISLQ